MTTDVNYVKLNDMRSFASHAFMRVGDDEYTGQTLFTALLFHCSGAGGRSVENEREIAAMLDDPNLEPERPKRRKKA
jgi:hypothetical protein